MHLWCHYSRNHSFIQNKNTYTSFQILNKQALFLWFLNFICEWKENINTDIVFVGKFSVRLPSARPCIITIEGKISKEGHFWYYRMDKHIIRSFQYKITANMVLISKILISIWCVELKWTKWNHTHSHFLRFLICSYTSLKYVGFIISGSNNKLVTFYHGLVVIQYVWWRLCTITCHQLIDSICYSASNH